MKVAHQALGFTDFISTPAIYTEQKPHLALFSSQTALTGKSPKNGWMFFACLCRFPVTIDSPHVDRRGSFIAEAVSWQARGLASNPKSFSLAGKSVSRPSIYTAFNLLRWSTLFPIIPVLSSHSTDTHRQWPPPDSSPRRCRSPSERRCKAAPAR